MRILVSMSLPKLLGFNSRHLGRLLVPAHTGSEQATLDAGVMLAADNGCFKGLDEAGFLALAERVRGLPIAFVTVPDVVGDAAATRRLWDAWAPRLRAYGVPLAYVAQDGEVPETVPWHEIDAVFIGGSTRFKLGAVVRRIVQAARKRGKHVHMGRVNTINRVRYVFRLGVDTIDGSAWAKWSDTKLPRGLQELDRLHGARDAPEASRLDAFGVNRAAAPHVHLARVPIDVADAVAFVARVHRHLSKVQGGKYAVAVARQDLGDIVGVAIMGRPVAAAYAEEKRLEVTRVAVVGGEPGAPVYPNACTLLYGGARLFAKGGGYEVLQTYTRADEHGASLRAAGFTRASERDGRVRWEIRFVPRATGTTHLERKRAEARRLAHDEKMTVREVAVTLGVSKSQAHRLIKGDA